MDGPSCIHEELLLSRLADEMKLWRGYVAADVPLPRRGRQRPDPGHQGRRTRLYTQKGGAARNENTCDFRSFPGQFNSWTINCKVLKTISSTVRERIQIQTRRPCYTGCRGYKEAPAGWRPPVIGQRSTPSVKSHLSIYQWRLYSATLWGFIPPADVQSFQARRTQKRSDAREFVTGQPASGPKSAAHRTTAGVNPTLLFDCAVTVCSASFSQLAIRLA